MRFRICSVLFAGVALAACSGEPGESSYRSACEGGLAAADQDLSDAKAGGFGDSVKWTKAASLIGAARVQQTFEEYQNCAIKAREARQYIREMRG